MWSMLFENSRMIVPQKITKKQTPFWFFLYYLNKIKAGGFQPAWNNVSKISVPFNTLSQTVPKHFQPKGRSYVKKGNYQY